MKNIYFHSTQQYKQDFQSASTNLITSALIMTTTEPRASPRTCKNTPRMFSWALDSENTKYTLLRSVNNNDDYNNNYNNNSSNNNNNYYYYYYCYCYYYYLFSYVVSSIISSLHFPAAEGYQRSNAQQNNSVQVTVAGRATGNSRPESGKSPRLVPKFRKIPVPEIL